MTAKEVQTWELNFSEFVQICTLSLESAARSANPSSVAVEVFENVSITASSPVALSSAIDVQSASVPSKNKDKQMLELFHTVDDDHSGSISVEELKELLGQNNFMGSKLKNLSVRFGESHEDGLLDDFSAEVMKSIGVDNALLEFEEFRREFSPFFDNDGNILGSNSVVDAELNALASIVGRLRSRLDAATDAAMDASYENAQQLLLLKDSSNLERAYSDEVVSKLERDMVQMQSWIAKLKQEAQQSDLAKNELKIKNLNAKEDMIQEHKTEQVTY